MVSEIIYPEFSTAFFWEVTQDMLFSWQVPRAPEGKPSSARIMLLVVQRSDEVTSQSQTKAQ